ncbi:GAF domain-containing protein [Nocardia sp. CA-128927]|uniref:GAF domain-containing protein n=1 Tax=Nocardia sp. CA-128927 TaxID=3239975 RepID=UPI003D9698B6
MQDRGVPNRDELLIETLGPEPRVVAENGRVRDFRKISSVLRPVEGRTVTSLVAEVVRTGAPVQRSAQVPDPQGGGGSVERRYAGYPVAGPDNIVAGVQLVYGTDVGPSTTRASAFQWELDLAGGPPRLHLTPAAIELLEVPEDHLDRSVFGPLDFFGRVARMPDVVHMWQAIVDAAPGYAESGTVSILTGTGRPAMMLYAQRYVPTDVGPRLRAICQDVTATVDQRQLRVDMLDLTIARVAFEANEVFGVVLETRYPSTMPLKWLTAWAPGMGHGLATGQTPGMHPDDILRIPELVQRAQSERIVRDSVRIRKFGGGWLIANFVAQVIDPEVSPTLALALVTTADKLDE